MPQATNVAIVAPSFGRAIVCHSARGLVDEKAVSDGIAVSQKTYLEQDGFVLSWFGAIVAVNMSGRR